MNGEVQAVGLMDSSMRVNKEYICAEERLDCICADQSIRVCKNSDGVFIYSVDEKLLFYDPSAGADATYMFINKYLLAD